MTNVLILGGAGYLGLELCYALGSTCNYKVTIFDNLSRGHSNIFSGLRKIAGDVKFYEADILDQRALRPRLDEADIVINLAGLVVTSHSYAPAHHFEQINNWGCSVIVGLLEECAESKLVIHSCSFSVYGEGTIENIRQSVTPQNFYGQSKANGTEHFIRMAQTTNHSLKIVRLPSIFGYSKNFRLDSPANRMVFDAHFKNRVTIMGDLEFNFPHTTIECAVSKIIEALDPTATFSESEIVTPPTVNLHLQDLYTYLVETRPEIEAIFIDQGRYNSSLTVSENAGVELYDFNDLFPSSIERLENSFIF